MDSAQTSMPDRLPNVQNAPHARPILTQTHDLTHAFHGFNGFAGQCRLRIYQHPRSAAAGTPWVPLSAVPVVIATELPESVGPSITNAAEYLAAEVLTAYLPARVGCAPPFVWVEHYGTRPRLPRRFSAPDLARVTFADWTPRSYLEAGHWRVRLGEPAWERLGALELRCLICKEVDLEG